MDPSPPLPGLQDIYEAVVYAHFRGHPETANGKTLSMEEVASVTYDRLASLSNPQELTGEEESASAAQSTGVHPSPHTHLLVLGVFTAPAAEKVFGALAEAPFRGIVSTRKHFTRAGTCLVLELTSSAKSIITKLAQASMQAHCLSLSDDPAVHLLRLKALPLPERVPRLLPLSRHPSSTLMLLNVHSTRDEISMFLAEECHEVERLFFTSTALFILASSTKSAESIYAALEGRTINGHPTFIAYYPEALRDIELFN
ncbi:hypothetical protein NEDG_00172 [Nematocida displodere]|uniref:Uncharacterized protein n=1 Tax=Nematocida displodere TaxID=1805483 RepID=A0A177EID4_9MICR|nr:hypothetical protein NEDG_00172 [Nematocida displodere]